MTVLNSQRELLGAAMRYLGYSVQERDPARWAEAKAVILRAKPYWAAFSNSTYIKDLAIGNIWVAHGYSNDMFRAREDAQGGEAALHHRLHDAEGGRGAGAWTASSCTSPAGGRTWRTASSTSCSRARTPPTSRTSSARAIPTPRRWRSSSRTSPAEAAIFPPPADLARLEMLRDFDPALRRTLSRLWTEIKVR